MDFQELRSGALEALLTIIDSIPNPKKSLVLDKNLNATLSSVASFSTLKEHGVDRIFWLQTPNLASSMPLNDSAVVYLASSYDYNCVKIISSHVQHVIETASGSSGSPDVHIIMAPEATLAMNQALEDASILGDASVHSWPVYLLPSDGDLLTLNLPGGGFKDLYVNEASSPIYYGAQAIDALQQKYGLISRITAKGDGAQKLVDILLRKRDGRRTDLSSKLSKLSVEPSPEVQFEYRYSNIFVGTTIDQLIVIDRQADLLTPLLSQLTYQGLVDEFYPISDSGQVELPASIVNPPANNNNQGNSSTSNASSSLSTETKKTTLGLSHGNNLFSTIRDLNFSMVGQTLNKVARQLQADYEQRHEAKTVSEIRQFVSRLGGLQTVHQALRFHTSLAEQLMTKVQDDEFNKSLEIQQNLLADTMDLKTIHLMIENMIGQGASLATVLRLLAIECLCNGGIKPKELTYLKQEILQSYGYKHILTLQTMERVGLIFPRSPSVPNNFPSLRRSLNLISDQQQELSTEPTDTTFAYSGYAPLSVRLVQCVVDKQAAIRPRRFQTQSSGSGSAPSGQASSSLSSSVGWKGAEDIVRLVPGATVDQVQRSETQVREGKLRKILTRNSPNREKTNTLVFFLGGITYAELAALRHVASKPGLSTNLIVASTGYINGQKVVSSNLL